VTILQERAPAAAGDTADVVLAAKVGVLTDPEIKAQVEKLLRHAKHALGLFVELGEEHMNTVTALSAGGPA